MFSRFLVNRAEGMRFPKKNATLRSFKSRQSTQGGEKTAVITVETLVSAAYNKVCLKSLKLAATKINLMIEP